MDSRQGPFSRFGLWRAGCILLAVLQLAGCDNVETRAWTEDVLLEDGTQVQVERSVRFTEHNSLSGDAYGTLDEQATLTIHLHDRLLPAWDVPLVPLLLFKEHVDEWVIVARSADCETWYQRGRPKPPYWEFRLRHGEWIEVPLSLRSLGRRANLFSEYRGPTQSHVSLQDKESILSDPTIARSYTSIDADAKTCQ